MCPNKMRICWFVLCRLLVGVEDAQSDSYIPVTVLASSDMTIAQLKEKVLTPAF